jgi:hypothetical protein
MSQMGDRVPPDANFTFGSDDVQLPQAVFHAEPGIHGWQNLRANRQRYRSILVIERFQPRHTGLTNFALSVVKDLVRVARQLWLGFFFRLGQ